MKCRKILKRVMAVFSAVCILAGSAVPSVAAGEVWKPNKYRLVDNLDKNRGLVAMQTSDGIYLTWRLQLDEDDVYGSGDSNVSFDIYRDGNKIAVESDTTNYIDKDGNADSEYQVVVSGEDKNICPAVKAFSSGENYFDIPIVKPDNFTGTINGTKCDFEYLPNDASCGDVDGDGEYEIILKWEASPRDSSDSGLTGHTLLDAYELDGTRLWDDYIDLGPNIRTGAHDVQFLVYDFDGDGKAEITCKTAPGSKDSAGAFVNQASKNSTVKSGDNNVDYHTSKTGGFILKGPEYFTIFSGETGRALDTVFYPVQLVDVSVWGDTQGNRCGRYLADVAYLDGENPYAVYWRGYYYGRNNQQRTGVFAAKWDGTNLTVPYCFDTYDAVNSSFRNSSSSYTNGVYNGVNGYDTKYARYVGQGNHNLSVADVDNDGKDELLSGAMCMEVNDEDKFRPKWCTFRGHGDAMHIGDYDPTHSGYEYFVVHEEGGTDKDEDGNTITLDYGMSVIDPANGKFMYHNSAGDDTGRGMMANVGAGGYYQFWGAGMKKAVGNNTFQDDYIPNATTNFRIFWDGTLYDNLLDAKSNDGDMIISAWTGSGMRNIFATSECSSNNSTKHNPALTADLFGDWREELICRTNDNKNLRVYTTNIYTDYKMKSLMYDNVYRCGVAAEQTAYNQPPHIGYYIETPSVVNVKPTAPVPAVPDNAEKIIDYDFNSFIPGYYAGGSLYNGIEYTKAEGLYLSVGQNDDSNVVGVQNIDGNDNALMIFAGNYSTAGRGGYIQFVSKSVAESGSSADMPKLIELENGQKATLSFALKLVDGMNENSGEILFLKDREVRNNAEFVNKITSISTADIGNDRWVSVKYEMTKQNDNLIYNLYIDDLLKDKGTVMLNDLPILAAPTRSSSTSGTFSGLYIDNLCVYKEELPAATPTPDPLGMPPYYVETSVYENDFEDTANSNFTAISGSTTKAGTDTAKVNANSTNIFSVIGASGGSRGMYTSVPNASKNRTYVEMDFRIDGCSEKNSSVISLTETKCNKHYLDSSSQILTVNASSSSNGYIGAVTISNGSGNIDITKDINISNGTSNGESSGLGGLTRDTTGWIKMYAALDYEKQQAEVTLQRISDKSIVYSGTVDFVNKVNSLGYIYCSAGRAYGVVSLDNINVMIDPDEHPSPTPRPTEAVVPTFKPYDPNPTVSPTAIPTVSPTAKPTATPTVSPTAKPTATPTVSPTAKPTATPTVSPTAKPTATPTVSPTAKPTATPTVSPTAKPTATPTVSPTAKPTATPTVSPTAKPTATPTVSPTAKPTAIPTVSPIVKPTIVPIFPTIAPTVKPTASPDDKPTATPTVSPTASPDGKLSAAAPKIEIESFIGGKRITLTTQTDGADIYYTTDGTIPSESAALYAEPIEITETTTIKAVAVKNGMENSKPVTGKITVSKVEDIDSSLSSGEVERGTVITLKSATSGTSIYYTTDGSEPTISGIKYTGAVVIASDVTIKAIAVKDGYISSNTAEFEYTVPKNESENVIVSVGSVIASAGDTVSVPVYLFMDDKITGFNFEMNYDPKMFEFISVTPADGISSDLFSSSGSGKAVVMYDGNAVESGEVCTVNLKALSSALDGNYQLKMNNVNVKGSNSDEFAYDIIDGQIELKGSNNSTLDKVSVKNVITDKDGNDITDVSEIKGEITANMTVEDIHFDETETKPAAVNVLLAVYDRNGSLVSLATTEVDISNINYVFTNSIDIPDGIEVGSVKMMIWNTLGDMAPLAATSRLL